jgi:hypothetical protein
VARESAAPQHTTLSNPVPAYKCLSRRREESHQGQNIFGASELGAIEAVEKIQNVDQRRAFPRTLASVVGTVCTEPFVPIGMELPDLLPDKQDLDKT